MKHLVALVPAGLLLGCMLEGNGPEDPSAAPPSVAAKAWVPGTGDTCPVEVHDRYSTVGPDGKRYPTWHPPVDLETGCSFGHEHGRDPRGSSLYDEVGDIPFGYANEQLDIADPTRRRHEDHVGHKVEWENNVEMNIGGVAGQVLDLRCDVLIKLHQGTHSKDAFTNNLHELVYHVRCSDGTEIHATLMAAIGKPGEFVRSCDDVHVTVGPATPVNSPEGGGKRLIPDRTCIERHVLVSSGRSSDYGRGLHESWQTSSSLKTEEGRHLASFDPYFQVDLPSRFHDPALAGITGRPIEVCYETPASGLRARGGACESSTGNGTIPGVTFNDPRSPFRGSARFVDINSNRVSNLDGPEEWYTDPFGKKGRTTPFPGSIRQYVSRTDNSALPFHGPRIGQDRVYGVNGVHPPN
jgi:hypothetical protein